MEFTPWRRAAPALFAAAWLCAGTAPCPAQPGTPGKLEQLELLPKFDVHSHFGPYVEDCEDGLIGLLDQHHLRWMMICVKGTDWPALQRQIRQAEKFHSAHPAQISWASSFNLQNWGAENWTETAIAALGKTFDQGAVAVKVWKEIGMVLEDPDGRHVMIDDPRFDPIFDYIESRGRTLVAHIGEPRNCWLPLDQMTVGTDRAYYTAHPEYHAYLHPEIPGYWEQIQARDHVLARHPNLRVVGCHLGSLEFDTDELAKRLDQYPNFAVDLAQRIIHFQVQDREKVRRFVLKYQDRLLYGTDNEAGEKSGAGPAELKEFDRIYREDYRYFATADEMDLPYVRPGYKARGLDLPMAVLGKIYHDNALKWYPGI